MKENLGSFLVAFRPGEVIGAHNEREVMLRNICKRLGGFDCKVFDPYMVYSGLADSGLLARVEEKSHYGFWTVFFFYPKGKDENEVRRKIANMMLDEAKNDPKLPLNGCAVVSDKDGNLKLGFISKQRKNVLAYTGKTLAK